jgi:protein-S-isoprenylcysteine O-methyltransferase Ste14
MRRRLCYLIWAHLNRNPAGICGRDSHLSPIRTVNGKHVRPTHSGRAQQTHEDRCKACGSPPPILPTKMSSCAFATPVALDAPRALARRALSSRCLPAAAPRPVRAARMAADGETKAKTAKPEAGAGGDIGFTPPAFEPPSFDTTVFSDFVENAQARIDEMQGQIADVDTEALAADVKTASVGLVDNLIAGDWLNRGELYGAVQLLFVVLLLRSPGLLDSLVGFFVGPVTLAAGALISAKAAYDLGRKQLSLWPAPVPGSELRTGGLYDTVRHPVYAGLVLASLGYAAATGSPERLALTIALAAFLTKKIAVEEEYLVDAYPEYESYRDSVPYRLIPRIW